MEGEEHGRRKKAFHQRGSLRLGIWKEQNKDAKR